MLVQLILFPNRIWFEINLQSRELLLNYFRWRREEIEKLKQKGRKN